MDKKSNLRKDVIKRGIKKLMSLKPRSHDDPQHSGAQDESVTIDVVLPIPYSKEHKEADAEPPIQTLEVSYGVKVTDIVKHVCKECGLDESAYVITFGDSDRSVHPDLEIEAINCTEFYLKNKMHLALRSDLDFTDSQEDCKPGLVIKNGRNRSSSVGSGGSTGKEEKKSGLGGHFSRPHIFTELNHQFQPCGTVFLQVSERYILFSRTADVYEVPKFTVFDFTEDCRLVDLGQEMPRILGPSAATEFSCTLTLRSPRRALIIMAESEKEKKAWINTLIFYAGTREVIDLALLPPRGDKEKEREAIELAELQLYSNKLTPDTKRIQQLRSEIATKADRLNSLLFEVDELQAATQRLLESANQELDLNKVRYEQVDSIAHNTKEISQHLSSVKKQLSQKNASFAHTQQSVKEMKERMDNLYKIEVVRKARAIFFQSLVIFLFVWGVLRLLRNLFGW